MIPEVILEFAGGYLRHLKPEDVHPGYASGLNDPEVNRYLQGVKRITQTEKTVAEFVRHNQQADNAVLFGIWLDGIQYHCGTVRLYGIETHHKTAHIGICLFYKSVWGKKLGYKTATTVTQWAFDKLKLRWVEAGAYSENISSQKIFLAAGYKWVYDIPDKYILEGKPTTVKIYAARNSCN